MALACAIGWETLNGLKCRTKIGLAGVSVSRSRLVTSCPFPDFVKSKPHERTHMHF
jgi:hypothetical protein